LEEKKNEWLPGRNSGPPSSGVGEAPLLHKSPAKHLAGRRLERGQGKAKAIIYTAVFLLFIYAGVKLIPPYVSEYQLNDKMQEMARFAVVNRYNEEQVRDNIYRIVQDLEIPAKREDIKVFVSQATVKVSLDYTVPVDLLFYHVDLHFTPNSENKSLT
jgi:hypothetical protein